MKKYNSIANLKNTKVLPINEKCVAFYKYDGSNLSFHYNKKFKFYKFATRNRQFDKNDCDFGEAIDIFNYKYAQQLEETLKEYTEYTVYCEFLGPHSFAGKHSVEQLNALNFNIKNNDPKDLVLFDVNIHKKGMIGPFDFIEKFKNLHKAEIIYQGIFTHELIKNVKENKFSLKEGVIVKGGNSFDHSLWMLKIKTNEYLDLLKNKFDNHWTQYE